MRAVIVVLLLLLITGCFPHNAKHRRYAKLSEGGAIATGILMLSLAGTGADCSAGPAGRDTYDDCRTRATMVGNVGLGLILAGLLGFTITTVTTPDETTPATSPAIAKPQSPARPSPDKRTLVPR